MVGSVLGRVTLAAALTVCASCDTRAQPSIAATASSGPDRLSAEHESCATTAYCVVPLRCFDHVGRRTERSLVGDYCTAVGAAARDAGELEGAVRAYGEALARYQTD